MNQASSLPARLVRTGIASLVALSLPATALAAPKPVRVHIQAPLDYNNPAATNLNSIEGYGAYPVFSRSFEIPYATLENLIDDELDKLVPSQIGDTEVCTDPCPDVTWSVKISPKFKFTKKNQPVITSIGTSSQNKVKVELTTQARLDVHADVHAETWFESVDEDVDIYLVVGVKAAVEIDLWPELDAHKPGSSQKGIALEFSIDDKNIDLDLNDTAVALGAKWGTLIGLSPAGLAIGGPILGPILAALGNEGADMAEEAISEVFHQKVEAIFNEETAELEDMVNDYLDPYIQQAEDLKGDLMGKKLPGTGKTLAQLHDELDAKIELHTVTPNGGVATSAVMRFSGASGSAKVSGKMRVPKKTCQYATVNGGPLAGAKLPLGLVDTNEDLKRKVGQACSSAMGGGFERKVYLGADPRHVLGNTAESRPTWKSGVGQLSWKGNMTETDEWYECSFEMSKLPDAGILELESESWLESHQVSFDKRVLAAKVGATVVLDNHLDPLPGNTVVLGGPGKCSASGAGGRGIQKNKLQALKDLLDPEKCPQCGIKRMRGMDHVIQVTNGAAFAETGPGKELLRDVQKAKASAGKVNKKTMNRGGIGKQPTQGARPGKRLNKSIPSAGK